MARIKIIEIAGETKMISIDTFNKLIEQNIPFKDIGTKEI